MNKTVRTLRMNIVGGALFLVPFVLIIFLLYKVVQVLRAVVTPLARQIPFESLIGMETPFFLALFLLIVLCFLVGLFAKTKVGRDLVYWLEKTLFSYLPGYSFLKNIGEEAAGFTPSQQYQPVLVRFDDAWQLGFLIERIEGGRAVIFIPDAPNPWSGGVYIFDDDRLTLIDEATGASVSALQKLGVGMAELVKGKITPTGG